MKSYVIGEMAPLTIMAVRRTSWAVLLGLYAVHNTQGKLMTFIANDEGNAVRVS